VNRSLIVNADDFGQSAGINSGVIRAYEEGILTSASLMVRWPAAQAAAAYAREHRKLSVGLHFDLGEWIYREGEWEPLYEVEASRDGDRLLAEVRRQLGAFRRLMGQDITHLDSHQHVHREEPLRTIMIEMAGTLGVPLRSCTPRVSYDGSFYGETSKGEAVPDAITADALVAIFADLPAGVTELGCHPGLGADFESYAHGREQEVEALCDPSVRAALEDEGIELRSFHDLPS
jgi:chitin disaccharide deacetylase